MSWISQLRENDGNALGSHDPKVVGSNPTPATNENKKDTVLAVSFAFNDSSQPLANEYPV